MMFAFSKIIKRYGLFLFLCTIGVSNVFGQTITVSYPNVFCHGTTADLSVALPVTGKTFSCAPRASSTVSGAVPQTTLSPTINQTLNVINSASATGTIAFDVIDDAGKKYVINVTVYQIPRVNTANWIAAGCGNINSISLSATGTVSVPTDGWAWSRPDTLGVAAIASTSNVINDVLINNTSADLTIPYTVSMTGANGCKSQQILSYKISPTPIIIDPARFDTICSGTGLSFTPKTQIAGSYITWANPATSGITGGTTVTTATKLSAFNQTLTNTTAASVNSTYNIYPAFVYTGFTCTGPAFQAMVTINPRPKIASTTATVCSGTSLKFTPAASGNIIPTSTQYTWVNPQYSDNTQLSGGIGLQQSPTIEYADPPVFQTLINKSVIPQTATYNIYAKAGSCISTDPFDLIVTVNPVPVVTVPSDTMTVCSGSSLIFSSKTPLPSIVTYSWAAPQLFPASSLSGTGSVAQTNQATFSPILNNLRTTTSYATYVVLPNTSGCTGSPFNLTVKVDPVASLTTQYSSICSDVNFISTPNPVPIGTKYSWSSPTLASNLILNSGDKNINALGDTAIIGNLTYTGTASGANATYTVIPKSGNCIGNAFSLIVTVKPIPVVTTASATACSGVSFSSVPTTNLPSVLTSYSWESPQITPIGSLTGGSGNSSPIQSITQTLINSSNDFASAKYTVTPVAQGCVGKTFSFIATVNPSPNILNKDTTICPGTPFSMNPSPLPFLTNYTWTSPQYNIPNTILGGTLQQTAVPNFSQILTNTTNSIDVMATYNVTPYFGNCVGKSFAIVVTIKASPYIVDTLHSIVCSGSPFNVTLPSNLPIGSLFKWEEPTYTNGISGGSMQPSLQSTISQTLKNNNSDTTTGIAYYNVTPVANGCYGKSFPVKVLVKTSSATLTSSLILPPICSGTSLNYIPTSNFSGTAFSWTRDSVPGISNASTTGYADISENLINTTGDPITINYRFSLFYNGCKNFKEQLVSTTINPKPILISTLNPISICSDGTFNYTPVSNTRDVAFSWTRSYVVGISQALTNGVNSISEKLTNSTYNIVQVPYVYTLSANGCINKQTVYEIVNPVLTLNDQTYPVCSGVDFKITPPNDVNAVFLWNRPYLSNGLIGGKENNVLPASNLNDVITNSTDTASFALYEMTPIIPGAASGGCLGLPFKVKVLVNPVPILSSLKMLPDICSGVPFKYTPTSNTPGTIFAWTRTSLNGLSNGSNKGNGAINETLLDTTINPINIAYRFYTTYSGCTDSSQYVKFTLNPSPIVPDQKVTICSGKAFNLPLDLEPVGTKYTWTVTSVMPSNTIQNPLGKNSPQSQVYDTLINNSLDISRVFYSVKPINSFCAIQNFNVVVTVKPISTIGDQSTSICSNKTLNYTATNVPAGTQYKWIFNANNPSYYLSGYNSNDSAFTNPMQQFIINSGTNTLNANYLVHTITDGCVGNPFQLKVDVHPIPSVRISGPQNICINGRDSINLDFTGYSPWSISYKDNKDNLLTQKSGFLSTNSYLIQPSLPKDTLYKIVVMNVSDKNCSTDLGVGKDGIITFSQKLNPLPVDSIIAPNGNLICLGQYQPMFIKPIARSYQWYRNDSIIPNANSVNYNAFFEGKYSAFITDSLGCSSMAVNDVKMADLKNFNIKFTNDSINCIQNIKQFYNLSDTSLVRNISWKWDFNGEGTTSGYNTLFTFKKSGLKRITLQASVPSCTYSITKDSILAIGSPRAGLVLDRQTTNAFNQIQLKARTFEGTNITYNWEPSWGLNFFNIKDPIFSYYQSQTYFIKMTFPDGCITVDTVKVNVFDSKVTSILIPKSFTPNGDGTNDILYPYPAGIKTFGYLRIFNKYGKIVFESKNATQGWDGKYSGTPQPMDTYFWEATGLDSNGILIRQTGNIILIR